MILICVDNYTEEELLILQVDSFTMNELEYYSKTYIVTDLGHYMGLQIHWLEEEKYYLGIKLNHNPTNEEVIDAWVRHHNSERFRAFYVLRYPEKVVKNS